MLNIYELLRRAWRPVASNISARFSGGQRGASKTWRNTGRPNAARNWHDRTEFYQSNALEAAVMKRLRRAEKLMQQANRSWSNNYAHHNAFRTLENISGFVQPLTLNPFYVAK